MREVPLLLPAGHTAIATLERSASESDVAPGEDGNRVRLSSLPVLLAGPILRYAADDELVVWVATSVPVTVVGRVMDEHVDSHGQPSGSPEELRRGRTRPVQLATNLFVTHVSIPGPFPKRKILSYDLTFVAPPGCRFPLCQRRLRQLPSGYLCSNGRRMVSRSCRSIPQFMILKRPPTRPARSPA